MIDQRACPSIAHEAKTDRREVEVGEKFGQHEMIGRRKTDRESSFVLERARLTRSGESDRIQRAAAGSVAGGRSQLLGNFPLCFLDISSTLK